MCLSPQAWEDASRRATPWPECCPWKALTTFDGRAEPLAPLRRLQDVVVLSVAAAASPLGPASGSEPRASES